MEISNLRIAICISGQPRTWKSCYTTWLSALSEYNNIDFFFHLWDYNTLPNIVRSYNGGISVSDKCLSDNEKQEIISTLKPKKYLFESRKDVTYRNCTIPITRQIGDWCSEQFYSQYRVSLLKREFEIDNDFRYDLVLRMRTDVWLDGKISLNDFTFNTAYTVHNSWSEEYGCYRIGDIFYYADSYTYDQMSEYYKYLSFVPTNWVTQKACPPPEVALYNYMMNIGLKNKSISIPIKIMRTKEYLDIKGGIERYEISEEL